jgi:hypothetical protein
LALDYATDTSNRKAAKRLNRIRLEAGATRPTTYRNLIEREGMAISKRIEQKSEEILKANGFNSEAQKLEETEFKLSEPKNIEQAAIENGAINLNIWEYNAADYELPEETVNISIDDVCVKRQTEMRPKSAEKEQAKRVGNTVIHVETKNKSYILNAESLIIGLKLLTALLMHNGLLEKQLVIFSDGARAIHNGVLKMLEFANIKIILDWYHLKKKCQEQLSMALKGSKIRNELLDKLLPCLWFGNVDGAIKKLKEVEASNVKNYAYITALIEYFERVRPYIPCYALRKELGLRNSSNLGEKSNDIVVSSRQKHNGMSWSNDGSNSFAAVTTASHNQEIDCWLHNHDIDFTLREAAA